MMPLRLQFRYYKYADTFAYDQECSVWIYQHNSIYIFIDFSSGEKSH